METMKVKISVTLEVNVEGWMMDYGIPKSEVREDVREYVNTLLNESNQNFEVK
jgi:6-pyruvoyl-tetrahydropterin synthase